VGIPAMVALTRRTNGPTEDIVMGFGAHLDPAVALTRALTEMNQFCPAVLSTMPDGTTMYGVLDRDAIDWWRSATTQSEPYLSPEGPTRGPTDYVTALYDDAGVAANAVATRLESLGHEVLVLDQTRPEIGLPVVKAIVPGMRHFWARLAPGRLYDVPVRTGALDRPTRESDLNPIAMFL
jgi:oxazoline/thiazoline synthase